MEEEPMSKTSTLEFKITEQPTLSYEDKSFPTASPNNPQTPTLHRDNDGNVYSHSDVLVNYPISPNTKKTRHRHKQELLTIQRALSVSRIPSPPSTKRDEEDDQISSRSAEGTEGTEGTEGKKGNDTSKRGAHINRSELCMEFCWCFSCCLASHLCRSWANTICANNQTRIHCRNVPMYDCLYALLFSPIYNNDQHELTRTQKLIIFIRLCFELYKTMIGSYLTVFTPQRCDTGICTLTQNLIPRDNMEIVALGMNSIMAFLLLCEYAIELMREKVLRMYFENDPRLPVEKEYFTNLLGILDTKKATLLSEKTVIIRSIFQLYRRLGIVLLSVYVANICISGAVIYKNYYDRSSVFGFITNALFIVFKMASILKIAIHSIQIPYSAYIDSPVAFNSLKHDYIRPEVKYSLTDYIDPSKQSEHGQYFMENRQYLKFLLENFHVDIEPVPDTETDDKKNIVVTNSNSINYFTKTHKADIKSSLCMVEFDDIEAQVPVPDTLKYGRVRHHSFS